MTHGQQILDSHYRTITATHVRRGVLRFLIGDELVKTAAGHQPRRGTQQTGAFRAREHVYPRNIVSRI
jgi:hypothetical protein